MTRRRSARTPRWFRSAERTHSAPTPALARQRAHERTPDAPVDSPETPAQQTELEPSSSLGPTHQEETRQ